VHQLVRMKGTFSITPIHWESYLSRLVPIPSVPINRHRKESCAQKLPPWSEMSKRKGIFHRSVCNPMCNPSLRVASFALLRSPCRASLLNGSRDVFLLFQCHLRQAAQCSGSTSGNGGSDCRWVLSCARIPTGSRLSCSEKGIDLTMSKDSNLLICKCPLHSVCIVSQTVLFLFFLFFLFLLDIKLFSCQ
jgi:hypothetical protein